MILIREYIKNNNEYRVIILDPQVIVVASIHIYVKDWSAYIGTIEYDCDKEFLNVVKNGTKISEKLATHLFPKIAKKYKWRD